MGMPDGTVEIVVGTWKWLETEDSFLEIDEVWCISVTSLGFYKLS